MTRERDRIQENANKYIVKNCKSNYKLGSKYICGAPRIPHYLCKDCTDCLVKRVIDKFNEAINKSGELDFADFKQYFDEDFALSILDMFDIQEVME